MIIHHDIKQHSDDWFAVKAGKWSSSTAGRLMSGIETKGFNDLVKTVAWERVYGAANEPRYQSAAMKRGNELEEDARTWYAFASDQIVTEVGFVDADIPSVGWSPDGLIINGTQIVNAVEIKCLLHKAFMDVIASKEVPSEYRWQVRWAMWCGKIDSMDFVPYHPQAGGVIIKCHQKKIYIEQMQERVNDAEMLVAKWIERLGNAPEVIAKYNTTEYQITF